MVELKNAFLNAFKEGLAVFFSPFVGVWQATGQLWARSARSGAASS